MAVLTTAQFPSESWDLEFWTQTPSHNEIDAYLTGMADLGWTLVAVGGSWRNGRFTYTTVIHRLA